MATGKPSPGSQALPGPPRHSCTLALAEDPQVGPGRCPRGGGVGKDLPPHPLPSRHPGRQLPLGTSCGRSDPGGCSCSCFCLAGQGAEAGRGGSSLARPRSRTASQSVLYSAAQPSRPLPGVTLKKDAPSRKLCWGPGCPGDGPCLALCLRARRACGLAREQTGPGQPGVWAPAAQCASVSTSDRAEKGPQVEGMAKSAACRLRGLAG